MPLPFAQDLFLPCKILHFKIFYCHVIFLPCFTLWGFTYSRLISKVAFFMGKWIVWWMESTTVAWSCHDHSYTTTLLLLRCVHQWPLLLGRPYHLERLLQGTHAHLFFGNWAMSLHTFANTDLRRSIYGLGLKQCFLYYCYFVVTIHSKCCLYSSALL